MDIIATAVDAIGKGVIEYKKREAINVAAVLPPHIVALADVPVRPLVRKSVHQLLKRLARERSAVPRGLEHAPDRRNDARYFT